MRANLDATLRLIDRESPEKSDLLSSTLRPHGDGPRKRPIFSGSNDRAYQILAAWAASLRPAAGPDRSGPAARTTAESGEAFAADRPRPGAEPLDEIARGGRVPPPRRFPGMVDAAAAGAEGPSYRYVEGQGLVPEDPKHADPREFPLPYMLGGPRPTMPGGPADAGNGRAPTPSAHRPSQAGPPVADRPASGEPRNDPVGMGASPSDKIKSGAGSGPDTPATKKKPVQLDPKALEKFLRRNANRTDGP
jgi:hypothetical protein